MSTALAAMVLLPLALEKGPDPADVKPGWLGFSVFLALAAAVVLLAFSFRKQLRKIDFEEEPEEPEVPEVPEVPEEPHDDQASGPDAAKA